jgi:hypothetical protein
MKGSGMKMTKKNAAIRLTVATVLSLGLSAVVMGVGSASAHGTPEAHSSSWIEGNAVKGVVNGYVPGSLISIEAHGTTPATNYALTSATTITGLATGASLLNDEVVLKLSTTTPTTVLSIRVETLKSPCIGGVVNGYVPGSLISIEAHGTTPATNYALTSATTIIGLATGASLLNDEVVLTLSTTTPATVLSIKVETNGSKCHGDKDGDDSSTRNSFSHGSSGQDHDHGNSSKHGSFRR